MASEQFTGVTQQFIDTLDLKDRKKLGQYMTPRFLGQTMAMKLSQPQLGDKILDPAVGTGELLLAHQTVFGLPDSSYHGWDVDENMLRTAQKNLPGGVFQTRSLFTPLPHELQGYYDYIIGNPPYFELKKDDPLLAECDLVTAGEKGRLNIYALFFEYALKLLKPGGEMVFLVPPSMNNGAYFRLTRQNILENAKINSIEIIKENTHFVDALTSVQIIHLTKTEHGYEQNLAASEPWVADFNEIAGVDKKETPLPVVFTTNKATILKKWVRAKNLHQLGFKVSTGKAPWNQMKNSFLTSDSPDEKIPLLYSKDISQTNQLELKETLQEQRYLPVNIPQRQDGQKIIVNRIIGALTNPRLRYAFVNLPGGFVTENHVNVIEPAGGSTIVSLNQVAELLDEANDWLGEYLSSLTGNTQLSAKELEFLIPFHHQQVTV